MGKAAAELSSQVEYWCLNSVYSIWYAHRPHGIMYTKAFYI